VIEIIGAADDPRALGLQPAAFGGDEDGLGAIDGAELAVDVV
jgi:hypothetical protein